MVKPRRAKNRPARVLIPLVVLLGIAIALFGWQTNFTFDLASQVTPPTPSPTASSSPRRSAPSPTADRSPQTRQATNALRSCRARVKAADAVIEAADSGVGHWSEHVEAQTRANRNRISVTMLDKVFDETRDAGPQDQKRYSQTREAFRAAKGSCEPVAEAPKDLASDLASCRRRAEAQERVMRAAEPAMADWKTHLEQMERSEKHPRPDDQEVWLRTWRAAPPHINAFKRAVKSFNEDDPHCPDRG